MRSFLPPILIAAVAAPALGQAPVPRDAVVARAEKMFVVADRDHDGWLSRDEYRAAVVATARRYDAKVPADDRALAPALARFDALAKPTGGRLSERAFVNEATAHFDGADLNHDGRVTPEEARRAQEIRRKALPAPPPPR